MPFITSQMGFAGGQTLIDDFLVEQQRLTAVDTFARRHEHHDLPAQARYYRDLIPLAKPQTGQQYAFEVDLDACTGCKSCVVACHSLNGLDEDESWRSVGLLVGGKMDLPVLQHVTTACHHCIEPACLEGCPVEAYEKDPITGIVKHLDDQCIGCQYCIFKCPYDVPRYNKSRGIVRKCDMCSSRLAVGEAPACVQSCPNQAIRITIVNQQNVIEETEANLFLPGAPAPDYTVPTTNYKTKRPLPRNLLPADHYAVAPQHAHTPLVVMLVFTQLSVGAFLIGRILEFLGGTELFAAIQPLHAGISLTLAVIAMAASVLHLGRPLYAFRAVIGLRTSWLSREILAFGLFALLASCSAVMNGILSTIVVVVGLLAVFCSVMVYHDTRRPFWHVGWSGTKFFLTTVLLGLSTTLLTGLIASAVSPALTVDQFMRMAGRGLCFWLLATSLLKLAFEAIIFVNLKRRHHTPLRRTAGLMVGPLRRVTAIRFITGLIGGGVIPTILTSFDRTETGPTVFAILVMFVLTLVGELLERRLFFTAVVAPKMPGGLES